MMETQSVLITLTAKMDLYTTFIAVQIVFQSDVHLFHWKSELSRNSLILIHKNEQNVEKNESLKNENNT